MSTRLPFMVIALIVTTASLAARAQTPGSTAGTVPAAQAAAPVQQPNLDDLEVVDPDAPAEPEVPPVRTAAFADVGIRGVSVTGDEARFQRFRDMGEGLAVGQLSFERQDQRSFLSLMTEHTGRRDQRYALEYLNSGKVKVAFVWDQIPQYYSRDTRTLYSTERPGVFRLDDGIQAQIQASTAALTNIAAGATPFDLRSRRHIAALRFTYSPTREVDVIFRLKSTGRKGAMPYAVTFGHSNVVELPAPVDSRTTDVTAGAEWANQRASVRVAYDGSVFSNDVTELIWDNPRRLTDLSSAPAQGRAALPPNNTLHAVTTTGSLKLPARSRVTGSVTLGAWHQDDTLQPFTINAALTSPPLARQTAQAEARTVAMNYSATSRPWQKVWLSARYRFYEFDNRTPAFEITDRARYDSSVTTGHGPGFLSSTRHQFDLDASLTPVKFTSVRVGYGREQVERTHRIFEETAENVFRASVDTTLAEMVTVRSIYEHFDRTGSGFDETLLVEVSEQPAMRHFDIADRERDRVTTLVQVSPVSSFSVSSSIAHGKDDYANSGFGLRDSSTTSYTAALDWVPDDRVAAGLSYVNDKYDTLQRSRSANPGPQFDDPTRDWSLDSGDRTGTWTADLDLLRLVPAVDVRLAYDRSRSKTTYVYGFPANTTLPAPTPLTPVVSRSQRATADVRYHLNDKLAVGGLYWFDDYYVEDFSMGTGTITGVAISSNIFLNYVYRPYRAHVTSVRLLYTW